MATFRTFVDTLDMVAVVNQRDQYHEAALELTELDAGQPFLMTEVVLLEVGNALACSHKTQASWSRLAAGIVFGLRLPLLVFKEVGISGGIFDPGVTEVFIHNLPPHPLTKSKWSAVTDVLLKWSAQVREHDYQ